MGSGKTTVGRLLAGALHRPFLDSDIQIEERLGVSGRQLAEEEGVDRLHAEEFRALREALAAREPSVIAAAASVGDRPEVAGLLGDAFVALLIGEAETLAARARSGGHRRLMDIGVAAEATERRRERLEPIATAVVDVTTASPDEVAAGILTAWN